jgi:hypothetical protein
MNAERVHTMTDYYDGPRGGIADFHGLPHLYDSLWNDEPGNWTDFFQLMPVDQETFEWALEDWRIWRRFEDAYKSGMISIEHHPALPEDKPRHEELTKLLGDRLTIVEALAFVVPGRFEFNVPSEGRECYGMTVQWGEPLIPEGKLTPASKF